MQISIAANAQRHGSYAHRPGGISMLSLLHGEEGSPRNFQLVLVEADGYTAPRHRHNFDQVRIVLEGAFGFDAGQSQTAGTVGYFPEGTYYTQSSVGRSLTLLLQSAGPSGSGYMSDRQLRAAIQELTSKGSFDAGVFTWLDNAGKKHNQDGYEAAWEHVNGREIQYPKPRFDSPVLWHVDRFPWTAYGDEGGEARMFGTFTERGLGVSQLRLPSEMAKLRLAPSAHERLVCVTQGEANIDGVRLRKFDSLRLLSGEVATIKGTAAACEMFQLQLIL